MKQMFFCFLIVLIIGCGGKDEEKVSVDAQGVGSINLNFKKLAHEVTKTVITVSGDDFKDLVYEFSDFENNVMLYNIPAGENRKIAVDAFDDQGALLSSGDAEDIAIIAGQITLVEIVLSPINEATEGGNVSLTIITNTPPEILSLTANPNPVFVSETVSFNLSFLDADEDPVTILWEADKGTFDNATVANPVWTAPNQAGDVDITLTLADGTSQTNYSLIMNVKTDPNKLQVVINEILADPADDIKGDANNDGVRSSTQDEFIEIVNSGENAVNLSGFKISDTDSVRHVFPENTILESHQALVIFGGGTPHIDDVFTQVASTGTLSLGNGGETISLLDTQGALIDKHVYGAEAGDNQSLTRFPDLTGEFVKHSSANPGALFSPGKMVDMNNF